jgi:serine/threonine protein phosphatase PrpC
MFRIACSGKSDIGLRRSNNEDALVIDPDRGFLAVADGMGGAASGEVASQIFVDTTREVFAAYEAQSDQVVSALVQKSFLLANARIFNLAKENADRQGMGCTAELLAFYDRTYMLGHVGDSRTYLFRDGILRQMTKDHSLVQDEIDQGLISPEEARSHAHRHVIVRAVGVHEELAVDLIKGQSRPGDLFLLCSDGLSDMIEDYQIQELLSLSVNVNEKAERLIEAAKAAGGHDNVTVALCEVL